MSTTIHTIERKPKTNSGSAAPLLLLLHGYGSNERDLFAFADQIDPRLHIVSARALLTLPWGGFAWYQLSGSPGRLVPDAATRDQALKTLASFVAGLPGRLGTDPRRTYLLGFSQGAIMGLGLAARRPELVAGVAALSGYLDPELLPAQTPTFAGMPILQTHGTDDEVIPVAAARRARDLLQSTQARYEYHEYPVGHTISLDGLQRLQSWLAERLDEAAREQ